MSTVSSSTASSIASSTELRCFIRLPSTEPLITSDLSIETIKAMMKQMDDHISYLEKKLDQQSAQENIFMVHALICNEYSKITILAEYVLTSAQTCTQSTLGDKKFYEMIKAWAASAPSTLATLTAEREAFLDKLSSQEKLKYVCVLDDITQEVTSWKKQNFIRGTFAIKSSMSSDQTTVNRAANHDGASSAVPTSTSSHSISSVSQSKDEGKTSSATHALTSTESKS